MRFLMVLLEVSLVAAKPVSLPEVLLDTRTTILVGCGLLGRHLQGQGPLDRRIGRYHSLTPERSQAYGQRVLGATPCTD